MNRLAGTVGRARTILGGFTSGQRGVVLVAALALVLGAVGLTRWVAQPAWTPLFSNLSGTDASAIVDQLRADNIQYQLADGGTSVLVPQSQVYDLRVALAGKGLPAAADGNGYSLLDKQGITATDFQQNVAYQRALEGELAKTLQAISGVQTAIVHLAIPKKDVFASAQDTPTASVLLAVRPGTTLERSQVRAVTHLVAGSVPGLSPSDVTVTDSNGSLLSVREDGVDGAAAAAGEADQQTAQFEDRMSANVQQMLDRVLGAGHAVVQVNAQLNFDTLNSTSERYVSETAAPPLSEATVHETYNGAAPASGGALGQTIPTLAPVTGTSGSNYDRQQRTVNNAVGKIVEQSQAAPGSVKRLTVAVVLDAKSASTATPTQIKELVSSAVGLDPTRGDSVQVDKLPFDTTATVKAAKELATAQSAAKLSGYIDLGKKAGLGLVALIVVLIALRRGKKQDTTTVQVMASDLPEGAEAALPHGVLGAAADPLALGSGGGGADGETTVSPQARVIEHDSLRSEVSALVDSQPEDVARMLQGWLSERKA